jgi:flagellar biosynthetic protein FliR
MDLFAPGMPQTLTLVSARVGGLVLVAPVFSNRNVPGTVKSGIIVLLSILLIPAATTGDNGNAIPVVSLVSFLGETLIGFGLGLGAAILIGAAAMAGDIAGTQIGLSGAAVFDPVNSASENVIGQFAALFALTMLLAVDGHVMMIDALSRSFGAIPIGTAVHAGGLMGMVSSGGLLFSMGLQFAAPVIATVLIGNTALAILSRAAPQLNVLSVAFPIQIGLGLFALAASVPFVGAFYQGWRGVYEGTLTQFLAPLVHAGAR